MTGVRDRRREEITARILTSARRQVAEQGPGALSMRAVARDVGMVSSAVFRYFENRDALLTALIMGSYQSLAAAIALALDQKSGAAAWNAGAHALRQWSAQRPHEFQLIYGTPVPGYRAPADTIPAAAAVAGPFLVIASGGRAPAVDADLAEDFVALRAEFAGGQVAELAGGVAELTQLIGFIALELGHHLVGVVGNVDAFFDHVVQRQIATLGLP